MKENKNEKKINSNYDAARTAIITLDYLDGITSDEDAKRVTGLVAEEAIRMGVDTFIEDDDTTFGLYNACERYGTVDEATNTTVEYYLDFYIAYVPELGKGIYVSVEGDHGAVVEVMSMINVTYTATK